MFCESVSKFVTLDFLVFAYKAGMCVETSITVYAPLGPGLISDITE